MKENAEIGAFLHLTDGTITGSLKQSQAYPGTRHVQVVDNIAMVSLIGPIYPRANMMTSSGATSIQQYFSDFAKAYNDPEINGVVQVVDSPGGDVRGIGENAKYINALVKQGKKPVQTYVQGYMASAAYYTASTSEEIYSDESGAIGSIGVVLTAGKKPDGQIEIVSSISPNKRPDAATEEGQSVLREQVEDLANIFATDIAKYRGTTKKNILDNYGKGAVKIGPRALASGMVDGISTLADVVSKMAKGRSKSRFAVGKAAGWAADTIDALFYSNEDALESIADADEAELLALEGAINMSFADKLAAFVGLKNDNAPEGAAPIVPPVAPTMTREELQDTFADAGELFANNQLTGSKIYPAQAAQAMTAMVNAKVDDKLLGGTVPFINAKGEQVAGTREEALSAFYEALPGHTLTQKAVQSVKADAGVEGGNKIIMLAEEKEDKEKAATVVAPERENALLATTPAGKAILAERAAKAAK